MEYKKRHVLDLAGHIENFLYSLDEGAPDDSRTPLRETGNRLAARYMERDERGNYKHSAEG